MSIFKTFIIDSSNKSRGDDNNFEIDIDKNYFNKTPNAIRLIDSNIPIFAELLNDTNNTMRVERLDDSGKILNYIDIKFPFLSNINSEQSLIDNNLNPNFKNQLDKSLLFDSKGYFNFNFVTNNNNAIPFPTKSNNQISNFSFGYYAISEVNLTENYAINFDVDNSIGPLLGFGSRRFVKSDKSYYVFDVAGSQGQYFAPPWYYENGFIKSQNKTVDLKTVNNINIENLSNIFIRFSDITETKYLFNITSGFVGNHLAAEKIQYDIGNLNSFTLALRGLYDSDAYIACTFEYTQRLINISSVVPITIDFGTQLSTIFQGVSGNDAIQLGNNVSGVYTNITNKSIPYLPLEQNTPIIVNATNSDFIVNEQSFKVPWNFINEDIDNQIAQLHSIGHGITLVNSVYNETEMFAYTKISTGVIEGSGSLIIDNSTIKLGDIVLINSVNDKKINGLYVMSVSSAVGKWRLARLFHYTQPNLNDFVFVRYNKIYNDNNLRNNIKYDNTIFKLTYTNSTSIIILDTHEIYFTEFTERFIPYAVNYISNWDLEFNNNLFTEFNKGEKYGVIRNGIGGVVNNSGGLLYINTVKVNINDLILINSQNPADYKYNGVYKCFNDGANNLAWELRRLNYANNIIYADNDFYIDYPTPYIGLEGSYDNDIIANPVSNMDVLVINSMAINLNDIVFLDKFTGGNSRYNGLYKCIDRGTGITSTGRWKLERITDINNEFLFDYGQGPYHLFIGTDNNDSKKLSAYKILQPSTVVNRKYKNANQVLEGLVRIINSTYTTAFPSTTYPAYYQTENLHKGFGNIITMNASHIGQFKFEYKRTSNGPIDNSIPPLFNLEVLFNTIGFTNETKKGEYTYSSNFNVFSNNAVSGSFNFILPSATTRKLTIPNQVIKTTNDLVNVINNLFKSVPATSDNRIRYNNFTKTYEFYHLNNTIFFIDFSTGSNIGELIGFNNTLLEHSSLYIGTVIDKIEDLTKPSNVYICSDLVDSVDSGCIVPLGGPYLVENLLFCIPNTTYNAEANNSIVLINSSLFVQKFSERKFDDNNKIVIKFWIKLPNGVGYVKKPWYMRTELIFENTF